ncbi:hypothetical protein DFH06DRAFT_1420719 [Mycena polygramma]|nr:hypothetical protein DFH06DRAFT_1420719 [Mycena polygramma]
MASPSSSDSTSPSNVPETPAYDADAAAAVYGQRVESGLLESIADRLSAMKEGALANIDFPKDFSSTKEEWSGNHTFVGKDGNELRVSLVGEIAGPALGTILRAIGQHYAGRDEACLTFLIPIVDGVKVKDCLALAMPTLSPTKMFNTWHNQGNTLGQISDHGSDEDSREGKASNPIVKSWIKKSPPECDQQEVIICQMLPKYAVPAAAGAPKPRRAAKRKLDETEEPAETAARAEQELVFPDEKDIKTGALYDPALLEDYGGPCFQHNKAKLVQLDVRDVNNKLVGPWRFYDVLRPGTLVLVLASLHIFHMPIGQDGKGRMRKIYQVNAHSVRVLSPSLEKVEKRFRPIPPSGGSRQMSRLPRRATGSAAAFNDFEVPSTAPDKSAGTKSAVVPSGSKAVGSGSSSASTLDEDINMEAGDTDVELELEQEEEEEEEKVEQKEDKKGKKPRRGRH